jgi:hypothetical protein
LKTLKKEIRYLDSVRYKLGIERLFENRIESGNKFVQNIKKCQIFEINLNDICVKSKYCNRIMQHIPVMSSFKTTNNETKQQTNDCLCSSKSHPYICGRNQCAANRFVCSRFILNNSKFNISKCNSK